MLDALGPARLRSALSRFRQLGMDTDLKHKYAPRRNKRYGHLPDFNALCDWAKKLDWENNDAHFLVLTKRVVENLDDELREERGMRIDQIASWDELMRAMRYAASWYEPTFRSIFIHLRLYVYFYLGDKLAVKEGAARKFPNFEKAA